MYDLERMTWDFVWGYDGGTRRFHSIAWNNLCSKESRGLGFWDIHSFNKALVMKLGVRNTL